MILRNMLLSSGIAFTPYRNAEDGTGGGAGDDKGGDDKKGDDNGGDKGGDDKGGDRKTALGGDAGDGDDADKAREYEPDASKSAEENAELKKAHDTKEVERIAAAKKDKEDLSKPREYKPDASKSAEENAKLKTEWDRKEKARTEFHGSPEKFEFKLPDGFAPDKDREEKFTALARELDLSAPAAQRLVDMVADMKKGEAQQWHDTIKGWEADAKKDKEIGGVKYDENVAKGVEVINEFGTKEFKQFLNQYGGGNHPEVIRIFSKIGFAMGEGLTERAKNRKGGDDAPSTTAVFYDNKPKGGGE